MSLADLLAGLHTDVRRQRSDMHAYQDGPGGIVQFLLENAFSAAFLDTGLGKTVSALTLIVELMRAEEVERVLVVAPIRVCTQTWPTEIAEWQHTSWLSYEVLRAEDDDPEVLAVPYEQRAAKKEEIRRRKAASKKAIHIVDIDHIVWLIDLHSVWKTFTQNGRVKRKRVIRDWPYDCVILDESSKFKDYTTRRYRALNAVRSKGFIKRLHELTATPAAEGYMGLFAQIHLLDQGERLGSNITTYRDTYFRLKPRSTRVYELMPGMMEKIGDKIGDITMVMRSKDYLDEIEPLFLPRRLNMLPAEAKQYKRFEREAIMSIPVGDDEPDVVIEATSAAALSGKLLQMASGAVYDSNKTFHELHQHKLEDLAELIDELDGSPLIVAYWYQSSLARLRKQFPLATVIDKAGKFVKPWNAGEIKVLLMHPASIGHGLNMQYGPGHDICYFDMCWSYELYYQSYRRIHRQGQTLQCRVHLPQMFGTLDVLVSDVLLGKEDAQEVLFERIRLYRRRLKEKE